MIDPKLHYCQCGCSWRPGTIHKLIMLLHGSYTRTCPQCQTRLTFRLIHHVVKTETRGLKNRDRIWKNA